MIKELIKKQFFKLLQHKVLCSLPAPRRAAQITRTRILTVCEIPAVRPMFHGAQDTENKKIKITNNANSVQAELSEDNTRVQIDVTEGDEISIVVSASYDGTVEFTLASYNSAE